MVYLNQQEPDEGELRTPEIPVMPLDNKTPLEIAQNETSIRKGESSLDSSMPPETVQNEIQNPEDVPVRKFRTALRKKGYRFTYDDNLNFLTCNTKTNNVVFPSFTENIKIDPDLVKESIPKSKKNKNVLCKITDFKKGLIRVTKKKLK